MATTKKHAPKGAKITIEKERSEFNMLIAANPNFFGTLISSSYKAAKTGWTPKTKYEELTCVGYNPKLKMLEATIQIKLPYGYGGADLCGSGSTEYVRFFIDYGGGWEDCGLTAVNVHDMADGLDCAKDPIKPVTYVVTQPIEPKDDWCGNPVLPRVRAILSWNQMPSEDPDEPPIWGNVLERNIQIKKREWVLLDILESVKKAAGLDPSIIEKIKLPKVLEEAKFDPIPLPDPPPLDIVELAALYKTGNAKKAALSVEPHRFGTKDLEAAVSPHTISKEVQTLKMELWEKAGLSWADAIEMYVKTKGDVSYEELKCLGLDCNRDWMVATFVVKKPCGYSGSLCDDGSKEYVAFWADWDNTCNWVYQGTSWIEAYDIASIPDQGLNYTVILPVDLSTHRQSCDDGPKIARIRAVLSWHTPPSTSNPWAIPTWGNRVDTHVQIKPKGALTGSLAAIGGVGVQNIDTFGNGMTKPGAKFAFYDLLTDPYDSSRECPFGGNIQFNGVPDAGSEYRLMIRRVGKTDITVLDSPIWITNSVGYSYYHYIKPNGYFDTLPVTANVGSLLSHWNSHNEKAEDKNALWEARMEVKLSGGGMVLTPWYKIKLDNTSPTASIDIDSGGACKDFTKGTPIDGHFVARDLHFGHYSLRTLPTSQYPPNPTPHYGTTQTAVAPGDKWKLETGTMNPCGYVVELWVYDRTIVSSRPEKHNHARNDVGFCLREKKS